MPKNPQKQKQKNTPRHIIFKLWKLKEKEKFLKQAREKNPLHIEEKDKNYIQLLLINSTREKRVE